MELPPEIRQVYEKSGYGCLAAETSRGVIHVCHAPDKDIDGFANQPVIHRWQLIKMPTAPLIRLELLILDNPANPYRLESFLNIAAAECERQIDMPTAAGDDEAILADHVAVLIPAVRL